MVRDQRVRKICLVRDERDFWGTIETYLGAVNAELTLMSGDPGTPRILECRPDLIVTGAKVHHGLMYKARKVPMIVVKENTPPVALINQLENRNLVITGWPIEKENFLEITSRMLFIAPRKIFRTIIRIFPEGEEFGLLGQSCDFSLTGVAFTSSRSIPTGQSVEISFSVPKANRSLRLGAEVVREADGDAGGKLYGARFVDLSSEQSRTLNAFVLSG